MIVVNETPYTGYSGRIKGKITVTNTDTGTSRWKEYKVFDDGSSDRKYVIDMLTRYVKELDGV